MATVNHEQHPVNAGAFESDPVDWPAWTDSDRWAPGPEFDADEPDLYRSLDAWIDAQADRYDALGTPAAILIGEELRSLGFRVRLTGAETPDEYRARGDRIDEDARECWRSAGFLDGLSQGRDERKPVDRFGQDA
jgi:hypothetical protein